MWARTLGYGREASAASVLPLVRRWQGSLSKESEKKVSRSTISTFKLFELFPDEASARVYLESRLWPNGVTCPECKATERITVRKDGYYRCNACKLDFTVRTGTIFERSHVPLHKWLYAMYLLVTARKGISSMQLAKEIGITQKSAWFVLHRLREACGKDLAKLRGSVEIDETFVGGLESNKHEADKLKEGRGSVGKTPVLGMRERGGRTKAMTLKTVSIDEIQNAIHRNIEVGSTSLPMSTARTTGWTDFSSNRSASTTRLTNTCAGWHLRTVSRACGPFSSAD